MVAARCVVNAAGVWGDAVRRLADPAAVPRLRPSQGVHVVVDGDFLPGHDALLLPRTGDGRVLFMIPWLGKLHGFANGGVFAEAGPEAVMPLARDGAGRLGVNAQGAGGNMVVNIIEQPGKGGTQQRRTDNNGTNILDVFVDRIRSVISNDIATGNGLVPSAMEGTYGLNRAAGL